MKFNYRLLKLECSCGNIPHDVQVGTTSHGCLILKWICGKCGEDITALMSFEDLIAGFPSPPEDVPAPRKIFSDKDKAILKAMHIKENL